jgi:hypothetical protein
VVEQVTELVQERERHAVVPSRDAQIDRIAVTHPVTAALARRRGRPDRHRVEVGGQAVQRFGARKGARELGVERTSPRQRHELGEAA